MTKGKKSRMTDDRFKVSSIFESTEIPKEMTSQAIASPETRRYRIPMEHRDAGERRKIESYKETI